MKIKIHILIIIWFMAFLGGFITGVPIIMIPAEQLKIGNRAHCKVKHAQ